MPVFTALAGIHGVKSRDNGADGAVNAPTPCTKFNVPVIVPVTVAAPDVPAVASAVIVNPKIYVVFAATPAKVAVTLAVVPVAEAVTGVWAEVYPGPTFPIGAVPGRS
jgi:hypothetical protein